jgi:hypothetical protein
MRETGFYVLVHHGQECTEITPIDRVDRPVMQFNVELRHRFLKYLPSTPRMTVSC